MNPNELGHGARGSRIGGPSRRSVLQAMAASGALAGLGAGAYAQEDENGQEGNGTESGDVPVAGEFPAGETVGLRKVAEGLPAPTDLDYVVVDDEVYHYVLTQTGQIYVTNLHGEGAGSDDEGTDGESDSGARNGSGESTDDDSSGGNESDGNETEVDGGGPASEDDGESADENDGGDGEPEEFRFNGVVEAWFGMEPEEIADVQNPTLELTAGETYRFTWENGDGQPHNVVILDAADEILERTEIVREAGETQTLEFEATPEMDRYICEVHAGTMVGSIDVADAGEGGEDGETDDADVATPADMDLFLDVGDRLVSLGIGELGGYDERGLLGIAFHPDFAENRRFYLRYSAPEREGLGYDHTDVLAEFEANEDYLTADPDSERTIMEVPQPQDNHNGGRLAFGPDGYLYTSVGDGGNVHDIGIGHVDDWYDENDGGNAQDTAENLLGGIHRIDVDAEEEQEFGSYGIPQDNPLAGAEGQLEEYFAWGFRNPWGMSIDGDGQLFVADAGQHRIESLYAVESGGNYGWNVKEGSFCFSTETPLEPPEDCPDEVSDAAGEARAGEELRDPIVEYQHTRISEAFIDSSVVVGGHRYVGETIPELEDAVVFGNWSSQGVAEADGEVLVATEAGGDESGDGRWTLDELQFEGAEDDSMNRYVYGIERDEECELYVLANTDFRPDPETGEIYRIVPASEGEEVPAPEDVFVVGDGADGEESTEENGEEPAADDDSTGTEDGATGEGGTEEADNETDGNNETNAEDDGP